MEPDRYIKVTSRGGVLIEMEVQESIQSLLAHLDKQIRELQELKLDLQRYFKGVSSGSTPE